MAPRTLARIAVFGLLLGAAVVACGDDEGRASPPAVAAGPISDKDEAGETMRAATLALLHQAGFVPPHALPTRAKRAGVAGKLRPLHEIAGRAMALKAVIAWSSVPEAELPSAVINDYVARSGLRRYLNQTELEILALERGAARIGHQSEAPWRVESVWALAWVLGFDEAPPFTGGRATDAQRDALLGTFVGGYDTDLKTFARSVQPRDVLEVARYEDLLYCAHAAARAAAAEQPSAAPATFDREVDGGSIHERRHALSWSLSPGVAWDQTDLTT